VCLSGVIETVNVLFFEIVLINNNNNKPLNLPLVKMKYFQVHLLPSPETPAQED
jgi:hypothetical protein